MYIYKIVSEDYDDPGIILTHEKEISDFCQIVRKENIILLLKNEHMSEIRDKDTKYHITDGDDLAKKLVNKYGFERPKIESCGYIDFMDKESLEEYIENNKGDLDESYKRD